MTPREIVATYLDRFCAGDVTGVASLLAEDLVFIGTLHRFDSKVAFLESLRRDPPERCGHRVVSLTEGGEEVAGFYEYPKAAGTRTADTALVMSRIFGESTHDARTGWHREVPTRRG